MNTTEFFARVLPDAGVRCVAVFGNGAARQLFAATNEGAAGVVEKLDAKPKANVYFGCATFKDNTSRLATNALAAKAFWLDIDCGETKPYADAGAAIMALKGFCKQLGLPIPLLVSSGVGVHAYWTLTEPLDPATWLVTAKALKAAARDLGLSADPTRTADLASVLRPVGAHHRKGEPRLVRILRDASPVSPDDLFAALSHRAVSDGGGGDLAGARPANISLLPANTNDDLSAGVEYAPASADKIADECGVVGWVREPGPTKVDQPTWYHVLQVLGRCTDGEQMAHEWSAKDPRYNKGETASSYARASQHGPTTCEKFNDHHPEMCGACPHLGKIKSPINLGAVAPVEMGSASSLATAITTLPALAEVYGGLVDIPHRIPEAEAPSALSMLAYVHDWGGSPSPVILEAGGGVRRTTVAGLREELSNRHVICGDGAMPAVTWWSRSNTRREYGRAVYEPEGDTRRIHGADLNLWRGFSRQPRRGTWRLMTQHILRMVCRSDQGAARYVLGWLAHSVQHPGTAPGTVLVLRSQREGTGKTTVGVWLSSIFGPHALMLNTPDQLVGRFNAHLEGKSFICLNEPSFPGDHEGARRLKSLITDPTWPIEPKGREIYHVPNIAHIMMTTNEQWAVPAGSGARRWVVLDVDDSHACDAAYFDNLYAEAFENGGIEAMLFDLLKLDLSSFDIRAIPVTDALVEQQLLTAASHVQWALDMADQPDDIIKFGSQVTTAALFGSYKQSIGERRGLTLTAFGRWFRSLGFAPAQIGQDRRKGWCLPDPDGFAAAVRQAAGIHTRVRPR